MIDHLSIVEIVRRSMMTLYSHRHSSRHIYHGVVFDYLYKGGDHLSFDLIESLIAILTFQ